MSAGRGNLLSITHLQKRFGDRVAVDDVSFEVRAGETLGLLGPNGAGKTTTLSIMSGLARPDKGSVSFQGLDAAVAPILVLGATAAVCIATAIWRFRWEE